MRLDVLDGAGTLPVGGAVLLGPSRLPGTFDRDAIVSAALLPDAGDVAAATLFYGALGEFYTAPEGRGSRSVRAGTAELRFGND